MKKIIKCSSCLGFVLAICVMVIPGCNCSAPKPSPDPLAGWNADLGRQTNSAIIKDYQDYIQKLPPDEKKFVDNNSIWFYQNEIGQHAVRIEIPLNGTWWEHVIFYNKEGNRIQVIKYKDGQYRS